MPHAPHARRPTRRPPRGGAARLVAALAVLAALLVARGAEAFERLPALGQAIEILRVSTCKISPDDPARASKPRPTEGSSLLDVEQPPPALALPRVRSGPNGKPGADDGLVGISDLVPLPDGPACRFDPEATARAAARREHAPASRAARTAYPARGPPAASC